MKSVSELIQAFLNERSGQKRPRGQDAKSSATSGKGQEGDVDRIGKLATPGEPDVQRRDHFLPGEPSLVVDGRTQPRCPVTHESREEVELAYRCSGCGTWYSKDGWELIHGRCDRCGSVDAAPVRWREDWQDWQYVPAKVPRWWKRIRLGWPWELTYKARKKTAKLQDFVVRNIKLAAGFGIAVVVGVSILWLGLSGMLGSIVEWWGGVTLATFGPTATVDADTTMYDNFNDPAFDGSYDRSLWRYWTGPPNQIAQQDGILIVTQDGTPNNTELAARKYFDFTLSSPIFFEAKLMLSPDKHAGNVHLHLGAYLPVGEGWFSQCIINDYSDEHAWANCWDTAWPKQEGHIYRVEGKPVDYGTWHTFRIEVDTDTMTLTYYIDGQMVGSHVPVDAEELKEARFGLLVGVWGPSSEASTGYIDDVRIGRLLANPTSTGPTPTPTHLPTTMPTLTSTATPRPTNTARPTPTSTATISSDPTVYDNFNNPAFDGAYNSGLWSPLKHVGVEQQNGALVFTHALFPTEKDRVLVTRRPTLWTLEKLGFLEAKLKLGSDHKGNYAFVKIQITSELQDHGWWTQCRLGVSQDGQPNVVCDVYTHSDDEYNAEYWTKPTSANYDTWYTARIEIDAETVNLHFYLDNQLLGSYAPSDASELRRARFSPKVGVWQEANSSVTGYVDDVRIGRLFPILTLTVPTATPIPSTPTSTPTLIGKIAFTSDRDGNREIYVMNADGTGAVNLTNNPAWDWYPAWSPDGKRIAFASDRSGNHEIHVMNADGIGVTRLTDNPAMDGWPDWSPDGKKIAFMSHRDGNYEIYVMNADGTGAVNLTNNPAHDGDATWSPDGRIAFISDREGRRMDVYVMNPDGTDVTRLTDEQYNKSPAWSPDGERIAFSCVRDQNNEMCIMNADGTGVIRLTDNPRYDWYPAWSPDGSKIAFMSSREGNYEIYVMNTDGTGLTNLTNKPADDTFPAWSR